MRLWIFGTFLTLGLGLSGPVRAGIDETLHDGAQSLRDLNLDQAIAAFTQVLDNPEANRDQRVTAYSGRCAAHYRISLDRRDREMTRQAIGDCDRAIELKSNHQYSFRLRGTAYLTIGEPARALDDLNVAAALETEDHLTLQNRGLANAKLGNIQAAIADFNIAIHLKPTHPWSYYNRGRLYAAQGDHEKAIRDFTTFLGHKPLYDPAFLHRGRSHMLLGRYQLAVADFYESLRLKPDDNPASHAYRGVSLFMLARYQEAVADFRAVMDHWAGNMENRMWLFLALERLGKPGQEAFAGLRTDLDTRTWPGVMIAFLQGRLPVHKTLAAVRRTDDPAERRDRESLLLFFLGERALMAGRPERARKWFEQVKDDPADRPAIYHAVRHELQALPVATKQEAAPPAVTPPASAPPTVTVGVAAVGPASQGRSEAPKAAQPPVQAQPEAVQAAAVPGPRRLPSAPTRSSSAEHPPGKFVFKVASFHESANAEDAIQEAKELGYPVYAQEVTVHDQLYQRVWVGPFGTLEEAQQARARVRAMPGRTPSAIRRF